MITGNIKRDITIDSDTFEVSGATTPINIVVVDSNNLDISECTLVTSEVIKTNPAIKYFDECGCPIDVCQKGSLRIKIKKLEPESANCDIKEFVLDDSGLVIFITDDEKTFFIAPECCEALGFEPEINPKTGLYQCRWKEDVVVDDCDKYTVIGESEGFVYFQDSNGSSTIYVPTKECCPNDTIPELTNDGYRCTVVKQVDSCSDYTATALEENGYVVFTTVNGGTTTIVPTNECCTSIGYSPTQTANGIACLICRDYVSYTFNNLGIAVFVNSNGDSFEIVNNTTCCPARTNPILESDENGLEDVSAIVKCRSVKYNGGNGDETCRYLKSINATPNPSGGFTSMTVSGKYCNGAAFEFYFNNNDNNQNIHTFQVVEACVIESSIVISPYTPQRVLYDWSAQSCSAPTAFISPINSGVVGCTAKNIRITGTPNSIVKYDFTTLSNGNHGFVNEFTYDNGNAISVTSGDIYIPNSGVVNLTWNLCARPTIVANVENCVSVKLDFKYNNNIIGSSTSTPCSDS
jgi:hypothetical protein